MLYCLCAVLPVLPAGRLPVACLCCSLFCLAARLCSAPPAAYTYVQLEGMLSPFGELKDCVVIIDKMSQKSKVGHVQALFIP